MHTEKDSATPDLDAIMQEGLEQFEIDTPGESPQGPDAPPPPDPPEGDAGLPPEDPPLPASPPPVAPELRFRSHEEAERGYRELQRLLTEMAEEKKSLLGRLGEKEAAEARIAAEEKEAQEFLSFATQRRAQVLKEIDELDPDIPDYHEQVAAAYARADVEIVRKGRTMDAAPPPSASDRPAEAPAAALPGTPTPGAEPTDLRGYVNTVISSKEVGLEPDDPLFWSFASQAPDRTNEGQPIALDEQIHWAVEQTNQYRSRILQAASARIAEDRQRQEMPLGRAGATPPAQPPQGSAGAGLVSLSDAVDAANELRRL